MIRVVIADDQALIRDGLRLILDSQPDIEVVAEAADGHHAVSEVSRLEPDIVLMDIRMPELDGLAATRAIVSGSATRVLMLTTFDLDAYVLEALRSGASGFLLKSSPREHLLHAVRTVSAGGALLDPHLTRRLVEEHVRPRGETPEHTQRIARLTEREREVFALLARGLSNLEIARELHLGETTVKSHVAHTLAKLDLRDRIQAVVFAYESGVARPGG